MQYGKDKPPMKCFAKLLKHWADVKLPTNGRKTPHYAKRKKEIKNNAPKLAHELHNLMRTNPKHKQCLTDTLDPIKFTWTKCKRAAQKMKQHTTPGASEISIDMLCIMLILEE